MNRITIKRINGEIRRFLKNKPNDISIFHNSDNILEIYFKFKGLSDTIFNKGEYICKIVHHKDYPVKAPNLYIITPNGRFYTNRRLCLTNTSYHQESWAPAAWNLESFIQAFISVFHSSTKSDRVGIGHIQNLDENFIKISANNSNSFNISLEEELGLKFI